MESTNLHELQDQPPAVEAFYISTPSCYGVGSSQSWKPNITSDAGVFNSNFQEVNPRSTVPPRPLNDSMAQDLGYQHWTSDAESCLTTSQSCHDLDLQFSKIREENSDTFPKFNEILTSPYSMEDYGPPPTPTTRSVKNEHKDMRERLLLKTLFPGDYYSTSAQNYPSFGGTGVPASRGNFSQIYPSINISNSNQPSPSPDISSSLDSSMHSLNLSNPTRLCSGDLSQRSQDHGLVRFTENLFYQVQHPTDKSSCNNSNNPSHFTNGMVETKRPSTLMESSEFPHTPIASKKSRSSCQPIKVRKEKLGDRIAALQQLVAPFGKTDTASVLMEAVGYIKFLQSQVETLSVPYMKSSRNQTNRVMQRGSAIDNTNAEPKQDLRSRGLCLVPLSCMMYIAGDGGSGALQQPNFGGAI